MDVFTGKHWYVPERRDVITNPDKVAERVARRVVSHAMNDFREQLYELDIPEFIQLYAHVGENNTTVEFFDFLFDYDTLQPKNIRETLQATMSHEVIETSKEQEEKNMPKIFSYDAETNGLWGQAFSIGAIVTDEQGRETARFIGRCPIEEEVNGWVAENVLPQMEDVPINYQSYDDLLKGFADFWAQEKTDGIETLTHMGMVVESKLWRDMHEKGIIGDWDAPYLTSDVCTYPEVGDSVDTYAKNHGLSIDPAEFAGGTHNPLYDSAVAAKVFVDAREHYKEIERDPEKAFIDRSRENGDFLEQDCATCTLSDVEFAQLQDVYFPAVVAACKRADPEGKIDFDHASLKDYRKLPGFKMPDADKMCSALGIGTPERKLTREEEHKANGDRLEANSVISADDSDLR